MAEQYRCRRIQILVAQKNIYYAFYTVKVKFTFKNSTFQSRRLRFERHILTALTENVNTLGWVFLGYTNYYHIDCVKSPINFILSCCG